MMINYDDITKENIKGHSPNWSQIPYHLYIRAHTKSQV